MSFYNKIQNGRIVKASHHTAGATKEQMCILSSYVNSIFCSIWDKVFMDKMSESSTVGNIHGSDFITLFHGTEKQMNYIRDIYTKAVNHTIHLKY